MSASMLKVYPLPDEAGGGYALVLVHDGMASEFRLTSADVLKAYEVGDTALAKMLAAELLEPMVRMERARLRSGLSREDAAELAKRLYQREADA